MKKFFIAYILSAIFSFFPLHAQDRVCEYFYAMLRYELCGSMNKSYEESQKISSFYCAQKTASFFSQTVWTFENGAVLLADFVFPEQTGLILSSLKNDSYMDSGVWISSLLEGSSGDFIIRRPDELNHSQKELASIIEADELQSTDEFSVESENYSSSPDFFDNQNSSVRVVKNPDNALVFYSYTDEFMSFQQDEDKRVVIRGDNNRFLRLFFDDSMRLQKKELWNYTKNVDSSLISYVQKYEYKGESAIPFLSEIKEEEKKSILEYDEKGRVYKTTIYSIEDGKSYKDSLTTWKFSGDGKVSEKYYEKYSYRNNKAHSLISTDSKKEVYEYKVDEKTPDYYYYENNELRMKTEYSAGDEYVTTTYFDGGFMVESYYKNDFRIKDLFYVNGIIKRTKIYEN